MEARKDENPKQEQVQRKKNFDDERVRLTSYQKNLLEVFKLTELTAGFQARPDAIGVFKAKSAKSGKLHLSLARLPKTVQISISPRSGFAGTRELSFLDSANVEPETKNDRVNYPDLVMTVQRMTVTRPAGRSD